MREYELPCYDGRKSFYGKAKVKEEGDTKELYSYDTLVATIDNEGLHKKWYGYSATTMRHVNSFLQQYGLEPINKKAWEEL